MSDPIADFNAQQAGILPLPSGTPGVAAQLPPQDSNAQPMPAVQPVTPPDNVQVVDQEDRGGFGSNFIGRSANALRYAQGRAQRAYDWTAAQPTPGGSGAILGAILLILFAAVPVTEQGKTRLELVYYTLMGKTFLAGRQSPFGSQGPAIQQASMQGGAFSDQPAVEVLYNAQNGPIDFQDI